MYLILVLLISIAKEGSKGSRNLSDLFEEEDLIASQELQDLKLMSLEIKNGLESFIK